MLAKQKRNARKYVFDDLYAGIFSFALALVVAMVALCPGNAAQKRSVLLFCVPTVAAVAIIFFIVFFVKLPAYRSLKNVRTAETEYFVGTCKKCTFLRRPCGRVYSMIAGIALYLETEEGIRKYYFMFPCETVASDQKAWRSVLEGELHIKTYVGSNAVAGIKEITEEGSLACELCQRNCLEK